MLDRAEAAMNEDPGNAIAILDSIPDDGLSSSQRMRRLLLLTNAQNKCDTVFHSDSIQLLLVDYYDRHGSANDRMLAHYLLGRAYYDMGEMPRALEAFQNAAVKADTTAIDCDYALLSRIYGQMSEVFYHQNLMEEDLEYNEISIRYAWKAKDTLCAIRCVAGNIAPYKRMGDTDSALTICRQAIAMAKKYGYGSLSASFMGAAISLLIEKDSLQEAKEFIDIYERESGYFNDEHEIESGRETYYNVKGRYYIAISKYDSAEYYFRKELCKGKDFNNQNGASRGLALLYQKIHQPDSAAKYALYSYAMNDSMYAHMATEEVERMKAMFDYSYHKRMAEVKSMEASRSRSIAIIMLFVTLTCILFIYITLMHIRRYKEKTQHREHLFRQKLIDLESQIESSNALERERDLKESEIRNRFADMLHPTESRTPSLNDWKELKAFVADNAPRFYSLINSSNLSNEEIDICILVRLYFQPKEIQNLTGLSLSNISVTRKRLLQKVFHIENGGAKDFDKRIREL